MIGGDSIFSGAGKDISRTSWVTSAVPGFTRSSILTRDCAKMLERMKPVTALVTQDVREISFPAPEKMLSPPIIAVDEVSVGYDPKQPVLSRVTLRIDTDDRIALLGSNGNGKSTLVKLLAGKLPPFSGHVTRAEKLSVGYFAQHQLDELDLDASPYDHVRKLMPDAPETK